MAKDTPTPSPTPTAPPSFRTRFRLGFLAACAFAVIFAGVNTGAVLRQDTQVSEAREKLRQSPQERLAALEARRRELVAERADLQRRLDMFVRDRSRRGEMPG